MRKREAEATLRVVGWKRLHPGEDEIDTILIVSKSPKVVYAETGIFGADTTFKSSDGGVTWRRFGDPDGVVVRAVDPAQPRTLYGTSDALYKTTDGGASWAPASRGLPEASSIEAVAIDPRAPPTLFATDLSSVFKSVTGGARWARVWRGPEEPGGGGLRSRPHSLAIDPKNPSIVYAAMPSGLFKSTDAGKSWRSKEARWGFEALTVDPRKPRTLYSWYELGIPDKSTDGGERWTELTIRADGLDLSEAIYPALAIDPSRPDTVYVAGSDLETEENFVLKSTTGGKTWVVVARFKASTGGEVPVAMDFVSLAVDPTGRRVYAGTDGAGIFVCDTCWKIRSPSRRRR